MWPWKSTDVMRVLFDYQLPGHGFVPFFNLQEIHPGYELGNVEFIGFDPVPEYDLTKNVIYSNVLTEIITGSHVNMVVYSWVGV